MRHTLHDLGSAHVPFLASSRKLDLEHGEAIVRHPLGNNGVHRAVLVGINYTRVGGKGAGAGGLGKGGPEG
jgi:hypothetical protein